MRVRGVTVDVNVSPARLARKSALLAELRTALSTAANGDLVAVDDFLARRLVEALEVFGERYVAAMLPVIERIARRRDDLTGVYDDVLDGRSVRPDVLRELFDRLDSELDSLRSPTRFAEEQGIELPPPRVGDPPPPARAPDPVRRAVVADALAGELGTFQRLDPDLQVAIVRAAEAAPEAVRRVVVSSEGQLERRIADLRAALRQLGLAEEDVRGAVRAAGRLNEARVAAARLRAAEAERLRVEAEIGSIPEEGLRAEVAASPRLRRHLPGGVPMLQHLWGMYQRYLGRGGELPFEVYAMYIQRHFRGDFGEFEAAFRLGPDFVLLKAPDHKPTIPGTDIVAICRSTGEVWVIDNKAFESAEALAAVGALTRNLPRNLLADALEFGRSAPPSERPIDIAAPLARLEEAAAAIVREGPAPDPARVSAILEEFMVRRVVSNAAGNVPDITTELMRLGIEFADMNRPRPLPPPEPPRIVIP